MTTVYYHRYHERCDRHKIERYQEVMAALSESVMKNVCARPLAEN